MRQRQSPIAHRPRRPLTSTTLLVRGPMAEHLRAGLYRELGHAGEQIAATALLREERQAEAYTEAICRMDAARSLLDELGWGADGSSVRVDMGKRRELVLRIFRLELDHALERMRDAPPAGQSELQRVVLDLGDYALHLQSLHV
jgi:hypothetical protein